MSNRLREVKEKIVFCSVCNNLTDVNPCLYCTNPKRDRSIICIVEEPYNLVAVEKTRSFRGLYHILHGSLSPIRGIGPDELMLANLLPRLMPKITTASRSKRSSSRPTRRPRAKRPRTTSPGC